MKKIIATYHEYHPLVWVLLIGTVFARTASFMSLPFLAIYLSEQTNLSTTVVGIAVGLGAISETIGGFIGGNLSDRYGRKVIIVGTLIIWGAVFCGFGLTTNISMIMFLNLLNGLCRSFFEPTSQALLSDITTPEKKMRVFSYRYTAINIGAAVGPLLGAYIALQSAGLTFVITGVIYVMYGLALLLLIDGKNFETKSVKNKEKVRFTAAIKVVGKDLALGYFVFAGILTIMGYAQMDSTLPLALKENGSNHYTVYPILLTINALVVVLFQQLITRMFEKRPVLLNIGLGTLLLSAGILIFALGSHWSIFVVGIIVFTFGEILIVPSSSLFVDQIAKEELKGTYFGTSSFRNLGLFIGPAFGGWLLQLMGGQWMFIIIGLLTSVSFVFYWLGYKVYLNQQQQQADKIIT